MPVQLILGYFVFSLYTLAYQELQRQIAWRHASTSRVGARPAHQFLGPDEEQLTLSGVLLPEFAGSRLSLELLEAMAATGRSWPLIKATGCFMGSTSSPASRPPARCIFRTGRPARSSFS
jgi:phage protein U